MKQTLLRIFISCLFLAVSTNSLASDDITSVTSFGDDTYAHLASDLSVLGKGTLAQLRGYQPASERIIAADIASALQGAANAGSDALMALTLTDSGRSKARISVQMYSVNTGAPFYSMEKEYKFKSQRGLLAQLEYDLPNQLKQDFKQQGRIVSLDSNIAFFDLGETAGVEEGQTYRVFRQGKEIKGVGGESFGYLDQEAGIIEVTDVSAVYAIAEIKLGRVSIRQGDWVTLKEIDREQYNGVVISKLDQQIAINLGSNVGVSQGAYFAVYKDIKEINAQESFREEVGRIRVTEVYDNFSTGEIAPSNHFSLAKAMITEGDSVEEVAAQGVWVVTLGQLNTSILSDAKQIWVLGAELESLADSGLRYRARGGYGAGKLFGAAGLSGGLNNSETFHYGLDLVYLGGTGANLFLQVDVPTPLDEYATFSLETGYMVGVDSEHDGLNIMLNLRAGF